MTVAGAMPLTRTSGPRPMASSRIKFSAFSVRSDGYVRNLTTGERNNGEKGYGLRGAVRLLPSDVVTWDLSSDFIRSNSG